MLYHQALHAPFVYDDVSLVQQNPELGSWARTLKYFITSSSFSSDFLGVRGSYYRPLTWLSLAVDFRLWGLNATGFHVTNLILTWANGVVGFMLLRRLGAGLGVALLSPLLWLALPINSEAVMWISARCYSLSVLFLLLALLVAERYLSRQKPISLALYWLATFASLLSHETGMLVLPLTLLIAYVQDRFRGTDKPLSHLAAAGLAADSLYLLLRHVTSTNSSGFSLSLYSFAGTFFKYLYWMVAPLGMSIERSTDTPVDQLTGLAFISWIGFLVLVGSLIAVRRKMGEFCAGMMWVVVALLPFCAVSIYQGMGERYEYLASYGLAFAFIAGAACLRDRSRAVAAAALSVWALWGVWRLEARTADWSNAQSLYESSLQATPRSWVLLLNLGNTYLQSGRTQEARNAYEQALKINGKAVKAAINLAASLQLLGDFGAAQRAYEYAISLAPSQGDIYTNLGTLVFSEGKTSYAEQLLNKAISLNPADATACFNLGVLYRRTNRLDPAIRMFQKTLQINPDYPDAQHALDLSRADSQKNSR